MIEIPHLAGVVHRVKHQAVLVRPDKDELLFPAAYELSDRHTAALGHGISEKSVRFLAALIGAEIVSVLEIDWID